jgi:curved DNA-binding protein
MAYINYYNILGIEKNATESEIKKAYRKMARKHHPDLNPNDKQAETKFKQTNEANEVLSHPESRKKYDAHGKDWKHAGDFNNARQQQYSGNYSDFFESMFGGRAAGSRGGPGVGFRGQDFNAELHLDLKEVYITTKRTLTVYGKNIRLTIPAGVTDGQKIRIKGQGGEGRNGGPKGDLYIKFSIENSTEFERNSNDLYKIVDLDLYSAMLGGDLTVETLDSKVKLKIKPETQNGTKVKLKGKGFPIYKKEGEFGDLYITYNLKLPTQLTTEEKELFGELQNLRL